MYRGPTMLSICFLTTLLVGSAWAQETVADNIDQVKNLTQFKQADLNKTQELAQEAFKKKCTANNAPEAYTETLEARTKMITCLESHVNLTKVQEEMKAAEGNGSLDDVFKKYCLKKDFLRKCLEDYTDTMKPCLNVKEQENLKIVHNLTAQIADFVCYKEGDRIALFIAEKGPICLSSMNDEIQGCVYNSTGLRDDTFTVGNVTVPQIMQFELEFNEVRCNQMYSLRDCVVEKLQQCEQPTPSNIAEALFKYVIRATPCSNLTATPVKVATAKVTGGSAVTFSSVLSTVMSALAVLALM